MLMGCNNSPSSFSDEISDSAQTEIDLLPENIIDDNYRNFYQIFVSSYYDSNGDKIGDLKGIDSKLNYIRDLGYTGIWLSPIFDSGTYHGYDTIDYLTIDEDLGTMDDLKKLVSDAHNLGIKIILDGVFNHTSYSCSWFKNALLAHQKKIRQEEITEEEKHYSNLYVFYDSLEEVKNAKVYKYAKAGGNDFYYECNFDTNMPELNFDEEMTYQKIQEVIEYYMNEADIDGFRLDATTYYYLDNADKNVEVLNRITKMVKDCKPNGYVVGECFKDQATIASYYRSNADSFFYFPGSSAYPDSFLLTSINDFKKNYLKGLNTLIETANGKIPAPFLDNHDMGRITKSKNIYETKIQLGVLGMLNGSTFNYYGDEIGMSSSENSSGGDANYRTHYFWDDETHTGECKNPAGSTAQIECYPDSKTQLKDPRSILNYVKKVNNLRNAFPAISRGTLVLNTQDSQVNASSSSLLSFTKTYNQETITIVINFSPTDSYEYDLSAKQVKTVLKVNDENQETEKENTLTLPSYGIAILA